MATLKTCSECEFYEVLEREQGVCHRFPPAATVCLVPHQHPLSREMSMTPQNFSASPMVRGEQWCGEFRASNRSSLVLNG
jgi:hypothetical protein